MIECIHTASGSAVRIVGVRAGPDIVGIAPQVRQLIVCNSDRAAHNDRLCVEGKRKFAYAVAAGDGSEIDAIGSGLGVIKSLKEDRVAEADVRLYSLKGRAGSVKHEAIDRVKPSVRPIGESVSPPLEELGSPDAERLVAAPINTVRFGAAVGENIVEPAYAVAAARHRCESVSKQLGLIVQTPLMTIRQLVVTDKDGCVKQETGSGSQDKFEDGVTTFDSAETVVINTRATNEDIVVVSEPAITTVGAERVLLVHEISLRAIDNIMYYRVTARET